jgi:hypothetical protein
VHAVLVALRVAPEAAGAGRGELGAGGRQEGGAQGDAGRLEAVDSDLPVKGAGLGFGLGRAGMRGGAKVTAQAATAWAGMDTCAWATLLCTQPSDTLTRTLTKACT